MNVKEQIRNTLDRATQDFDGKDEIMRKALDRINALESGLGILRATFLRNGWEENSLLIDSIDSLVRGTSSS